jgi:hypothetical protein
MDWVGLVTQVLALLLEGNVEANRITDLLGPPVEKDEKRWSLQLRGIYVDKIREAFIYFEDLPAGQQLITTVDLRLVKPWMTLPANLADAIAGRERRRAGLHADDPEIITYSVVRDSRHASIIFFARPIKDASHGEIQIERIMVRRFYGVPSGQTQ